MSEHVTISVAGIDATPIPVLQARSDVNSDSYQKTSPRFMIEAGLGQTNVEDVVDFHCGSEGHCQLPRQTRKASPPDLSLAGASQRLNWINSLKNYKRYKHNNYAYFYRSKRAHCFVQATINALGPV